MELLEVWASCRAALASDPSLSTVLLLCPGVWHQGLGIHLASHMEPSPEPPKFGEQTGYWEKSEGNVGRMSSSEWVMGSLGLGIENRGVKQNVQPLRPPFLLVSSPGNNEGRQQTSE